MRCIEHGAPFADAAAVPADQGTKLDVNNADNTAER
jgi:hypothetical protein